MNMNNTLVVNLYSGPGAGKSTNAALAFGKLKLKGVNTEYVTEFAKDLTWEGRNQALGFQPYVIGKQMYKIHRLLGQVDVIVTDSPIMLTWVYGSKELPKEFFQFVLQQHRAWNTLDIFLTRDLTSHPYNPQGRNQSVDEAVAIDAQIAAILNTCNIEHHYINVCEDNSTADKIVDLISKRLIGNRHA